MKKLIKDIRFLFKRWFVKRNIIVMSEHGVKHIPISGGVQFSALMVIVSFVCWASYSTGSFMAARHALKTQGQTLRTVASAHVATSFNPLYKKPIIGGLTAAVDNEPLASVSALSNGKMISRVAELENKVSKLQTANAEIIQRVQEKTAGQIDSLESIIKQTGLKSETLKKNAEKPAKNKKSEGGPFIPEDMHELSKSTDELFSNLDELSRLNQIVMTLPLSMPIKNSEPQSGFGTRYDPFTNRLAFHSGIDLSGPEGSKIFSTADGTVTAAERNGSYGNMVDIDHGNGITTRYGHLKEIKVFPGQKVKKGDWIGIQGSTGRSTGPHLHYEVRYNDQPMNPKNFIQAGRYVFKQ